MIKIKLYNFIRSLTLFLRRLAFNIFYPRNKKTSRESLKVFFERIQNSWVGVELVRIGDIGDGGYLTPDYLNDLKFCFSPGVDILASFEKSLSELYDIKSFLLDASVEKMPVYDVNLSFLKKYLGTETYGEFISFEDWIQNSIGSQTGSKMLQMDIEGAEYDIINTVEKGLLAGFDIFIIELHGLERLLIKDDFEKISRSFRRLLDLFYIVHIHPNNCTPKWKSMNYEIPPVLEITFLRKNIYDDGLIARTDIKIPHKLDSKNVLHLPDIKLGINWLPK